MQSGIILVHSLLFVFFLFRLLLTHAPQFWVTFTLRVSVISWFIFCGVWSVCMYVWCILGRIKIANRCFFLHNFWNTFNSILWRSITKLLNIIKKNGHDPILSALMASLSCIFYSLPHSEWVRKKAQWRHKKAITVSKYEWKSNRWSFQC